MSACYNGAPSIRKICLFSVFLTLFAVFSHAAPGSRHIYFQGTAIQQQQLAFFLENFNLEAGAAGYISEKSKADAAYTFKFDVARNMITYEDGTQEPAPAGEPQFIIQITLIRNSDDNEMVSFGFPFTDLNAMLDYTQYLFLRASINIPFEEVVEDLITSGGVPGVSMGGTAGEGGGGGSGRLSAKVIGGADALEEDAWRNKWLYARLSVDFPVVFYKLLPIGFEKEKDFILTIEDNPWYTPIDNRTTAQPAATLGIEVQVLNYLSLEPKIQANIEYLNDIQFLSAEAGLDIKFPLKFIPNVMVNPYLTAAYPLSFFMPIAPADKLKEPDIFIERPLLGIGGGMQVGIKSGKSNAIFLDISYKYYITDAVIKNHYIFEDPSGKSLDVKPNELHFQRTVIGLSLGYKFGFIDRKKK